MDRSLTVVEHSSTMVAEYDEERTVPRALPLRFSGSVLR
jgi:hypothetical protein